MTIHQLLYMSKAADNLDSQSVDSIVAQSRTNNSKFGISGALLFRSGLFLQLIEGDREAVISLFETKIKLDRRHDHIVKLIDIERNQRAFDEWSMMYRDMSDLPLTLVNEMLSWNSLIIKAAGVDNDLIIHILNRFKTVAKSAKVAS